MARKLDITDLTRREREIMEIVYRLGKATAVEVMDALPGDPANATVRTMLGILEQKGYLRHKRHRGHYVYHPTIPLSTARRSALHQVLDTFFKGAEASAVISILKKSDANISEEQANMMRRLIEKSREEGR